MNLQKPYRNFHGKTREITLGKLMFWRIFDIWNLCVPISEVAAAFAKSFMALAKAAAIAAFFLAFTVNDVQQREARIFVRRFERAVTCLKQYYDSSLQRRNETV